MKKMRILQQIIADSHFIFHLVVSIGRFPAFYVVLVPLEYIPSIPPHSTYVIVYFVLLYCRVVHRLPFTRELKHCKVDVGERTMTQEKAFVSISCEGKTKF